MNTRPLVTIETIDKIYEHPNADRLEIAIVNGWQVIILKDRYKEGERVIFYQIDSFIPLYDRYNFLEKSTIGEIERYRVHTIRLRGEMSQGLIDKLDFLLDFPHSEFYMNQPKGTDLTQVINVINYNALEEVFNSEGNRPIPHYIIKREEKRIQNSFLEYDELRKHRFFVTEKLDGQRVSFWYEPDTDEVHVGLKYTYLDIRSDHPITKIPGYSNIIQLLKDFKEPIVLAGELIGPKIQGNKYKLPQHEFYAFTVYNYKTGQRWAYIDYSNFCYEHGISMVPLIYFNLRLPEDIGKLLSRGHGKSRLNKDVQREGLIYRSLDTNDGFKVIDNEYLLKG